MYVINYRRKITASAEGIHQPIAPIIVIVHHYLALQQRLPVAWYMDGENTTTGRPEFEGTTRNPDGRPAYREQKSK
jgi:hypothetical protein